MQRFLMCALGVLLLQPAPRPIVPGATTASTQPVSAVALASWAARYTPDPKLELAVVWRGAEGWYTKGTHVSSSGGGSQTGAHVTAEYGGIQVQAELDFATRVAIVQGTKIILGDNNVVLVDNVDQPQRVRIAGMVKVDPAMPALRAMNGDGPPDIYRVLGRSPEVVAFAQCDARLPDDPRLPDEAKKFGQVMIDGLCARLTAK